MKALVSPDNNTPQYISSWTAQPENDLGEITYLPNYSDISNAQAIVQIEENTFEVSSPMFWVDCNSSVTAFNWYYDTSDSTIKEIAPLNASNPNPS